MSYDSLVLNVFWSSDDLDGQDRHETVDSVMSFRSDTEVMIDPI